MKKLYELIADCNPNQENTVLTALDAPWCGEQALVSGRTFLWKESETGFFAAHPEAAERTESGIHRVSGKRFYAESVGHEKHVVICGAGHVGIAIARMASLIGFRVTVIDDRPEFANQADAIPGTTAVCETFMDALQQIAGDPDTYFVIVTRGHRWDRDCLREVAQKPHAYIGLMGSRRRVRIVMDNLADEGIDRTVLDKVYTPIGLSIGAETPEEIAVSVVAELIQVKQERQQNSAYAKELLAGILGDPHEPDPAYSGKVLMTIVQRKGSAPRETGAKMLLFGDGVTMIGTIGGGCVEAEVLTRARQMLTEEQSETVLYHVDMTAEEAEEEGMVCGGQVDILIERLC